MASQFFDSFDIQAESFVVAMRDVDDEILEADPFEEVIPHGGAGNAVGVIVGIYGDLFFGFNGLNDPYGGFFRVFQQEWVVGVALIIRRQESLGASSASAMPRWKSRCAVRSDTPESALRSSGVNCRRME